MLTTTFVSACLPHPLLVPVAVVLPWLLSLLLPLLHALAPLLVVHAHAALLVAAVTAAAAPPALEAASPLEAALAPELGGLDGPVVHQVEGFLL